MTRPIRTLPRQAPRILKSTLGLAALTMAMTACDIPTGAPTIESRWVIPAETTRFGVGQLLPGQVTLTPDSSAFLVDFDPVVFSETLANLCPPCLLLTGTTVPKPAFFGEFSALAVFDPRLESFTVLDGEVQVEIVNGLNFDPLNPANGAVGSLTLNLSDSADDDLLGTLRIDGTTTPLPAGTTLVRSVPLLPGTVEGDLEVTAVVDSPTGDPVTLEAFLAVSVTVTARSVRVSTVRADVSGESVTLDAVELGVEEVDREFTDRIVSGALVVDVVNPFGIGADLSVAIRDESSGGAYVEKAAAISTAPESRVRLEFSPDELRSFLGRPGVLLTGEAAVDPAAGVITMDPGEELVLQASFDLILEVGG